MLEVLAQKGAARYATLSIPVGKEGIYLVKRMQPPQKDLYSMVGGKLELTGNDNSEVYGGSLKGKLMREGYEDIAESAVREFLEEMFHKKDFRWVEDKLVEDGSLRRRSDKLTIDEIFSSTDRMNEYTRPELMKYCSPKRPHDAIFDTRTGFVCHIYKVRIPNEAMPFSVSEREIGEPKLIKDVDPEKVNPITRFVLYQAVQNSDALADKIPKAFHQEPTNIAYSPLESIVMPNDFEVAKITGKPLQPSKRVANSYVLDY